MGARKPGPLQLLPSGVLRRLEGLAVALLQSACICGIIGKLQLAQCLSLGHAYPVAAERIASDRVTGNPA